MKKLLVLTAVAALVATTAVEARGGFGGARGFSGGRSFSKSAPARVYAPSRTTVIKKNTTIIQSAPSSSSGGGFWSGVAGAAVGSMAGSAVYAERMLAEKASPKPLPPGAIASCRGGTLERFSAPIPLAVFGLLSACRIFFMLLAKVLTTRHRMPTTRMFA